MKKSFLTILIIFLSFCNSVFAESWESFPNLDRAWDGQKSITNKEFEDAINSLEQKKNKQDAKKKNKLIKKIGGGGTSLHNDLTPQSDIKVITPLKKDSEGLILNVPVNLVIDDIPLDKGYYKVIAEKDKNNDIYLLFYQSQFFKGKVRACETNDDYDEDKIDFVKLLPYNEHFVKIILGTLEFNAFAYVRYIP